MEEKLSSYKQRLAIALLEFDAVEFGEFELSHHKQNQNAPKSPIRIRIAEKCLLDTEFMAEIGERLYEKAANAGLGYDAVAGVPNSGNPLAVAFLNEERLHVGEDEDVALLVNLKKEKDGSITFCGNRFDVEGKTVLLIENVTTTGGSALKAIRAIEENGGVVTNILVLVDRQQGAKKNLADTGDYNLHAVLKLDSLLNFYVEQNLIKEAMAERVWRYLKGS